ncbi:MAG: hypothetical protein Q7T20_12895 [Saprospiraceae bacterium]|nr:hypothetical protein [Saprospiraceae bacterium]
MRLLISISIIALIFLVACSKDGPDGYYWGTATARFNNKAWEADPYAIVNAPYKQGIDFLIHKFNSQGFQREDVFVYKVPEQVGKYPISQTEVRDIDSLVGAQFFTVLDDGGVLGDSYSLLEGVVDNYVEITKIKGDQVWAEFQVAFVKVSSNHTPEYPDTIVFTKGKIHTLIVRPE